MGANGGVPSGTVVRVAEVLKAVGAWGAEGARLIDLTSVTGLPRPTTHRILHELIDANLVRQSADRRYSLSPTALFMGTSVLEPFDNLPRSATWYRIWPRPPLSQPISASSCNVASYTSHADRARRQSTFSR